MAYFAARGNIDPEGRDGAMETSWACTGCFKCRESCDHRNPVAGTLFDARAEWMERGAAPDGAKRVVERFPLHWQETHDAVNAIADRLATSTSAACETSVLLGCTYAKRLPVEAHHAAIACSKLVPGGVRLINECCGAPLRMAGDSQGFRTQAERFQASLGSAKRVVVVDAGCARTLRDDYPAMRVDLGVKVDLFVDLAAANIAKLQQIATDEPLRYHDPCQLARGLGVTEPPRAVMAQITGKPVGEFDDNRRAANCSGAGGLLPITMPKVASKIAANRVAEHAAQGGGRIVTACASSLLKFRAQGAQADDIATWIARSLGAETTE